MSEDVRQKGIVVEANGKRATVRFKKRMPAAIVTHASALALTRRI